MTAWTPTKTVDTWEYASGGLNLLITQVSPSRRGVDAWLEMRWTGSVPRAGLVLAARFDLMGSRTVGTIVGRMKDFGFDDRDLAGWRPHVQDAVYDVVRDIIDGPRHIDLASHRAQPLSFVVRPLIDGIGSTSLVGAGGIGKSLLALAVSAAIADGNQAWLPMEIIRPGPVLYVDWEADADTHRRRLDALAAGADRPIPEILYYIEARTPLRMWAPALARTIARTECVLAVLDSVMMARAGEAAAEDTIAFFAALRTLQVPTLLLDHKSRSAIKKGDNGAFGSVVNDNTVRLQWDLASTEQGAIRLRPTKSNNYAKLPSFTLILDASGDDGQMSQARWEIGEETNLIDRIEVAVEEHPAGLTTSEVAVMVGRTPNQVRSLLHRLVDRGLIQKVGDQWFPNVPDPDDGWIDPI